MSQYKKIGALGAGSLATLGLLVSFAVQASVTGNLLPSSDGTYAQWTPKSGSTHYTMVDETTCNGTTDYVNETTVGQRDSYNVNISSVPNGAVISKIELKPCASRNNTGGGTSTLNVFYRWNGVDSSDAGNYNLPTGTTPSERATTTFSGLSLTKDASSTLQVGAVYTAGNKGIRLSRLATVLTYDTAPSAPSSLYTIVSSTNNNVALYWTDNSSNELYFAIERSTNGGAYSQIATSTWTSYTDTSTSGETAYDYRVRAYNAVGYSSYSNTASTETVPNVPTSLSATSVAHPVLTWTDNSSIENNVHVFRSTTSGSGYGFIGSVGADVTTFTDFSATTTMTYYYVVKSVSLGASSNFSNEASATTP